MMEKRLMRENGIWILLFSMVAGFFLTADSMLVITEGVFGLASQNYIEPLQFTDILLWLVLTGACFVCVFVLAELYRGFGGCLFAEFHGQMHPFKLFVIVSALIFLAWVPYLLSFLPGCLFADSFISIFQVLDNSIDNLHPIIYTSLIGLFLKIGMRLTGSLFVGIFLCTLVQMGTMALIMGYFVVWLREKGVRTGYWLLTAVFIAVFPLFPFYALTMWKDTPFSLALLLYTLYCVDVALSDGEKLMDLCGIAKYLVLTFAVCFFRNNGIYVAAFSFVVITWVYRGKLLQGLMKFELFTAAFLIFTLIIQGPVFSALGLSTRTVESLGIPNQQIFAVFTDENGEYTQEEADFIQNIWDLEEIAERYTPLTADTGKGYMERYDNEFLEENVSEYLKTWFTLCFKNFGIYVEAWLLETMSFWSPTESGSPGYIQYGVWENGYEIERYDLFYRLFGWDFGAIVVPNHYLAPGLLFWLAMLFAAVSFVNAPCRRKWDVAIVMSVTVGLWITLMIAAPIAVSLRYAYVLVLLLPILPVLPVLMNRI